MSNELFILKGLKNELYKTLVRRVTFLIIVSPIYCIFTFRAIVRNVVLESPVPITCKMRKVHSTDFQSTLNLAKRIEAAGCSALCLHGRTKVV